MERPVLAAALALLTQNAERIHEVNFDVTWDDGSKWRGTIFQPFQPPR